MTTIRFPDKGEIEEHSAQWVAAMDRGLSAEEKLSLESWLQESPLHAETLVKVASTWDLLDVLRPIAQLLPLDESPRGTETVPGALTIEAPQQQKKFNWLPLAAASVILAAASLLILNMPSTAKPETDIDIASNDVFSSTYTTEVGQRSMVNLPDGSVVNLNTNSELMVRFTNNHRNVTLTRGEAFFQVAKDTAAPFSVAAGTNSVTAVGTAFNVEINAARAVEVTVTEGRVQLDRIGEPKIQSAVAESDTPASVFLSHGEKVIVSESGLRSAVAKSNDFDTQLAWREGRLIFQGEPLHEVIDEINRYTSLTFTIVDPSIRNIPVGGFFRAGDTAQLLLVLEQNFGISSQRQGQLIRLAQSVSQS